MSLERPDGSGLALLSPGCAAFWTEHPARAGLDSWHAALGTELSQRNFLGRWATKSSADSYVRTAVRVVERLQIGAALAAATLLGGGHDAFGEEHVLEDMREHALAKGDSPDEIQATLTALTCADTSRYCDSPPHWGDQSVASGPGSPTEKGDSDAESVASGPGSMLDQLKSQASSSVVRDAPQEPGIPTPVGEDSPAGSDSDSSSPEGEELSLAARAFEPREEPPLEGFVIVKTRGLRRLHFAGRCAHLARALHREIWGETVPPSCEYTARCGTCFRRGEGPLEQAAQEAESSSSTDSTEED